MVISANETQLLVAAVLVLLGALSAYLTARVQMLSDVSKVHDQALNRRIRATDAKPAGGGVPPAWNQLNDPLPDGTLPSLRTQECGEEVASMMIMWRHGVPVSADALRALLRRVDGSALTTANDVAALLRMCNVSAGAINLDTPDAKAEMRGQTAAGRPVAVLVRVPTGGYHWLCAYSSDDTHVHYIDPWGGMRIAQ